MAQRTASRTLLTAIAALVVTGGLATAMPAPANAAPAAPRNLTPDGPVEGNSPVLSWSRVAGADEYEVEVDDDADFGSPIFTADTVNRRVVPTELLPAGRVHWRVRTIADRKASRWSTARVTVAKSAAPTLVAPSDGKPLPQPSEPPLLRWQAMQGAEEYRVLLDNDPDFVGASEYTTQVNSLVVPDALEATTYYWTVVAEFPGGIVTDSAEPRSFKVGSLGSVTRLDPDDDPDGEVTDVVLDWGEVPGARYYELRVSTDSDFNTIIDHQQKITGTRYSPKVTYDNNQYYWQVRAIDLNGNPTAWSEITGTFDRVWPHTPQTVHPAAQPMQNVTDDLYFQWTPVQHATQYELQVGSDRNFSPRTFDSCQVAGTTYTPGQFTINNTTGTISKRPHDDCTPAPGQVTYWRVRPLDRPYTKSGQPDGVQGLFSPTRSIVYFPRTLDGDATPAPGATVDIPTFTWDPVQDAESYSIEVFNKFGRSVKRDTTYATSYTVAGSKTPLKVEDGPFTWRLSAEHGQGIPASLIHEYSFELSGDLPTSTEAPLTPLTGTENDGPTMRAPQLTWAPMTGAAYYRIVAGPANSGVWFTPVSGDLLGKDLPYPAVTDTWTWFLSAGSYDWRVQAYDQDGVLLGTGPKATFTIDGLDAVTGQRIALDGTSLDAGDACSATIDEPLCADAPATPVFDWDPVEGAAFYMVYVSEDASFTNVVEPLTRVPGTSNTRWTPNLANDFPALPDSEAGGAYYWFVRPCKAVNLCGPSPISTTDMATNKFRKKSPAVVTTSPGVVHSQGVDGPAVGTTEITFDWQDYRDTNAATTWAASGEASNQSGMQYRIQVNTSPTFSNTPRQNTDDVTVDQSTYTAFTGLYPEGPLYWRVQAIDAAGNGLTWSPTRVFTKASPTVRITAPVEGVQVPGTTAFEWEAQPYASEYEIEVARNNDANFSPGNRLFREDVAQTAYVWDRPIPASSTPYVWRVRRIDAVGNAGPWSATRRFVSQGAAPELLAPRSGSYQQDYGALFRWSSVPGATSYEIEVRSTTTGSTWDRETTAATSWASVRDLDDGAYKWRVSAANVRRDVIGTSTWRTFRVDGTRPEVRTWKPKNKASRTANFVVKFTEKVKGVKKSTMRIYLKGRKKPVRATVKLSTNNKRATLNPKGKLKRGKIYRIKLTTRIRDLRGNKLRPKSWKVRIK